MLPVYKDYVRRACYTAPYCVGYSQDALGDTYSGKAVGIMCCCENTTLVREGAEMSCHSVGNLHSVEDSECLMISPGIGEVPNLLPLKLVGFSSMAGVGAGVSLTPGICIQSYIVHRRPQFVIAA